jgi:hypothetical protein
MMEFGEQTSVLKCEDTDFENTLRMISVLVKYSSYVFTQVSEETKSQGEKDLAADMHISKKVIL